MRRKNRALIAVAAVETSVSSFAESDRKSGNSTCAMSSSRIVAPITRSRSRSGEPTTPGRRVRLCGGSLGWKSGSCSGPEKHHRCDRRRPDRRYRRSNRASQPRELRNSRLKKWNKAPQAMHHGCVRLHELRSGRCARCARQKSR